MRALPHGEESRVSASPGKKYFVALDLLFEQRCWSLATRLTACVILRMLRFGPNPQPRLITVGDVRRRAAPMCDKTIRAAMTALCEGASPFFERTRTKDGAYRFSLAPRIAAQVEAQVARDY